MLKGKKGIRVLFSVVLAVIVAAVAMITEKANVEPVADGEMLVDFLDVGQGDCTLIRSSDAVILVDAGEAGTADVVISYLKEKGIKNIDCCIATHPHSDHIGALYRIFEEFSVDTVLLPDIPDELIPTTSTYEKFLDGLENVKNIIPAGAGDDFKFGSLNIDVLGPVKEYDDLNHMSLVSKVSFGNTSVMLTGDTETPAETDMLKKRNVDYSADILKVGHHGSKTSTSEKWLKAVNPHFAVVSCGLDNDYGHPHKSIVNRLENFGVEYYRTDLEGHILFKSDGNEITLIK
ncbi:MAG: ComEC/Rec2 family competence protein [Acutalibacteraceae bacterium]|nr:ComEC/Rec2 family competence protein [Acutalibacteraceae bacterium]